MRSQFFLEPAVGTFTGGAFEATDGQQTVVATQAVQEAVGVALVQRELHHVGGQHGVGGEAGVTTVFVGRVEHFDQLAGTGDYSLNYDFEETEAASRGLFVMVGIIRIDFAHEDFSWSEGASDRSA